MIQDRHIVTVEDSWLEVYR